MEITKIDIQKVYEEWEKKAKCMSRIRILYIVATMKPKDYAEAFWNTLCEVKSRGEKEWDGTAF